MTRIAEPIMRTCSRRRSRYPSDTTAAEWALIEPLLPAPACQTNTGGHPEKWLRRDIVDGIRYIVDNGAKWRALPADFPPWETVCGFFQRWNRGGWVTFIRDQLRRRIRTGKGRCPFPVTLIVDSQSIKAASTVGSTTRGYDAGKKVNGRRRHIAVDTLGLPMMIMVTRANMTDRDAAREMLWRLRLTHPQLTRVWADSAHAGQLVDWADDRLWLSLRTVARPRTAEGFVVLPRRRKVERTIGRLMNARRNVRDHERLPQHSEAHLNWALITVMTKRLTRKSARTDSWTKNPSPSTDRRQARDITGE
ncbi:IS5 family transposase [Streptomyces inhibens]|uniref:IS5 family transposase n=1 Tax=Streptomyces inhibens TaxID=2293571 RepID=UPI003144F356